MQRIAALSIAASAALLLMLNGCSETPMAMEIMEPENPVLRPRSEPIEFVGLTTTRAITGETDFVAVVDPLIGRAAREGTRHDRFVLDEGLFLSADEDARTRDQVVVSMDMELADGTDTRTVLRVPASFAYGELFVDVVRVALAETQERTTTNPDGMRPWLLFYEVISANGGQLRIEVEYLETREAVLRVTTENPRTSLMAGRINTAAFEGAPHERIGGVVHFSLSRDEFDFFSSRAYGVSAGREQNFSDFRLQPHDWLRITVTPMLEVEMVDVAFDVVLLDGRRVAFARAPASYVAGEQFRENVFRMVDNMQAEEDRAPGSSRGFTVPFHYDDPAGGGTVRVIATGAGGQFNIAYAVDSPINELREVDFVPYEGDPIGDAPTPEQIASCEERGSTASDVGRFEIRFDASSVVRESRELADPLRGRINGAIYRAEDVTISGPRDGAVELTDFEFDDVDLTLGASADPYPIDFELPAGEYQVLAYMDIDDNRDTTGGADPGDPVTLPIGGYTLECAQQPIVVEFALLLPEGF